MATEVQSLIFPKGKWRSEAAVKKWAKDHDFHSGKVDETEQSWRLRQREPGDFVRMRTICLNPGRDTDMDDCRVKAVVGPIKVSEKASEVKMKGKVLRTKDFLGKLRELLAGKIKDDELKDVISKARSHASAQSRARNKADKDKEEKLEKKAAYEDYSPKLEKTHESVDYKQAEKVGKTCGDCKFFYRFSSYDGTCQLVEGSINDISVCGLWEAIITVVSTELATDWRLFNELSAEFQFAEPPDWIPFLPRPGKYESPKYGDVLISRERNENFVSNFGNAVYQEKIAIDAEHESKLSGAFGWITEMRANEDGSVDAYVEWTELGVTAIKEDRFRYFSPEFYDTWQNPMTGETHRDVAVGGALTTRPFFKEGALRPIIASEKGLTILEERGKDTYFLIPLTGGEEEMEDKDKKDELTLRAKLIEFLGLGKKDDVDVKVDDVKVDDDTKIDDTKIDDVKVAASEALSEVKQLREELKENKKTIALLTESNLKLEQENRRKRFVEIVGDGEEDLKFMESIAAKFGEDSDEMNHYVKQHRAHEEQVRLAGLFNENGSTEISQGGGSAEAEFHALAKKFVEESEGKLDYNDAYEKAMKENPQLYERYTEESTLRVG